jgi:predicted CXXCH cytochrome family protein
MPISVRRKLGTTLLIALIAGGCVRTETLFVEQPLYEDPPAAASGFLGYTNATSERPVCGNCHIGQYGEWQETAHAGAWDDLQSSGAAQEVCEGCHSVGARGNLVTEENVGWTATADARYHDVQCESCHGPGLEHVTNPDATQPLASLVVGVDLTSGCGECHSGAHQPFVEEWASSRHGDMNPFPQTRAGCIACHEARGIFAAWGIKADYIEKNGSAPIPITCPVCHDPHDRSNPNQLRFPIDEPNVETNLCMKCHQRRSVPDLSNPSQAPHSPQGPLLLGEAGWVPPNFSYEGGSIIATHGTEANPRLCAGCHVNRATVEDRSAGNLEFSATGHLFKAIPCLDETGQPTRNEECSIEQRSFATCAALGCHGTQAAARSVLTVVRARIATLVETLDGVLDRVPATEFDNADNRLSTAEGARFNASLAEQPGSPIHNPFLLEALLTSSIRQVEIDYGIRPNGAVTLENILPSIR